MVPQTTTFFIDELCCADEEHCIRKRLATMEGVNDLTFDLISRKLMVMHSCPQHDLATALHEVGFTVHQHLPSTERTFWENNNQLILTCIAGTFLFLGIILSSFDTAQRIVIPLLLCSMVVGG